MTPTAWYDHEPPTGSVVVIDLGGSREEVWISDQSNIGNWYCSRVPLSPDRHPTWLDVKRRAEGRVIMLLAQADDETWQAGYEAGIAAAALAIENMSGMSSRP